MTSSPHPIGVVSVVLVPANDLKPLQSLDLPSLASEALAVHLHPDDVLNVQSTLLIRPTISTDRHGCDGGVDGAADATARDGQPGLYVHHEPNTARHAQRNHNVRATRLAMACGVFAARLTGDVIVSRGTALHLEDVAPVLEQHKDLRPELHCILPAEQQQQQRNQPAAPTARHWTPPQWLGDAARSTYHDKVVLTRLAHVMCNLDDVAATSSRSTWDDQIADDCDDDETELGAAMKNKMRTSNSGGEGNHRNNHRDSNNSNNKHECALEHREFVATVTLCLHCRRPASRLCKHCAGAYFCEEPRMCESYG
jgi:hypothetical protein